MLTGKSIETGYGFYYLYGKYGADLRQAKNSNQFMFNRIIFMLMAACLVLGSCKTTHKSQQLTGNKPKLTEPGVYIYKTRGDYSLLIPIDLSADKKSIVSYPDIRDVFTNGKLAIPTKLDDGFLLDNRGISINVAFLKLTYQQYAALPSTPSPNSLFNLILDNDPLTVLYDCGLKSGYKNLAGELNNMIKNKDFSKFKKL